MQTIIDFFGLTSLTSDLKNRLILALFCLLIFLILIYFWAISRSKIKANNKDGNGLVYLSIAYLLYAVMGIVSVYHPVQETFYVLSGLVSICYLCSLSFFSIGSHPVDDLVSHSYWKSGVQYAGLAWIVLATLVSGQSWARHVDMAICILALALLGFFITRYFLKRRLNFIAVVAVGYFAGFILLQVYQPESLSAGKFVHMNSIVLGPALPLSVIVMAYTFNWINELNFFELSNIWVSDEGSAASQKQAYAELTKPSNSNTWLEKIANDDLEKVIEEMIILRKHRNQNLEAILSVASQNTRNNNNQLKGIISNEDYQLNRNRVSNSLIGLAQQ